MLSINNVIKAHYILIDTKCSLDVLAELESAFKYNDSILRYMVIKQKTAQTEPSVMMKQIQHEEVKRNDKPVSKKVDWKNIALLKNYIVETGRIIPRRVSGVTAKFQDLATAIKRARILSLLPYCDRHFR